MATPCSRSTRLSAIRIRGSLEDPGRGKEASARYEKSMADAKVRHKAETGVSNPSAVEGKKGRREP